VVLGLGGPVEASSLPAGDELVTCQPAREASATMIRVEGEIFIQRPVDEVFDFVADERNEPRYNSRMRRVEQLTTGAIGVGTRFRAEMVSMGRPAEMIIEFTGYERPRRLLSATRMAFMELRGGLTFDPVGDGTLLGWSWELQPHGLLELLRPLVARIGRRQEQRVWTGLKRFFEEGKAVEVSA
jgi:hypothetical protein